MISKNFRAHIIVRILLIAGFVFILFYTFRADFNLTPIVILLAIIFQVISLIRYVDKTNRDLTNFLDSIRFSEFNRTFQSQGMGESFDKLNQAFNNVIHDFQKVRSEREEHYQYLQSIVQNLDVSIIAYTHDGTIEMINGAAKKLFQINTLENIKELESISTELVQVLLNIDPGKNFLVKVQEEDDILQLAVHATEFKIKNKQILLSTISNIQSVLEEQETESWQKLIRVLTHEIMNSITPIASLSSTLTTMLDNYSSVNRTQQFDGSVAKEFGAALNTINKRSTGLLHFVDTYRSLTRIPNPNFKVALVGDIFKNTTSLLSNAISKKKIDLSISVSPENLEVFADEQLIEQVLINLVKNSIHAIKENNGGTIRLKGFYNKRGRVTLQVADNGQGILEDVLDKIFIPFFTTKQRGSGIGLSLSKQILRLHNGSITASSVPEKETVFTMTF